MEINVAAFNLMTSFAYAEAKKEVEFQKYKDWIFKTQAIYEIVNKKQREYITGLDGFKLISIDSGMELHINTINKLVICGYPGQGMYQIGIMKIVHSPTGSCIVFIAGEEGNIRNRFCKMLYPSSDIIINDDNRDFIKSLFEIE